MLHLLVDDSRKVLISNNVSFFAELSYINLAAEVRIGHDVGDPEINHFKFSRQRFLNILNGSPGSLLGIGLRLGADDDHPARLEDQDGALGLGLPHDHCGKPLLVVSAPLHLLGNRLQIQVIFNIHLSKGHHVLHQRQVRLISVLLHTETLNQFSLPPTRYNQFFPTSHLWVGKQNPHLNRRFTRKGDHNHHQYPHSIGPSSSQPKETIATHLPHQNTHLFIVKVHS